MSKSQHFFRSSDNKEICKQCGDPKNSIKHITYPNKIKTFAWQQEI